MVKTLKDWIFRLNLTGKNSSINFVDIDGFNTLDLLCCPDPLVPPGVDRFENPNDLPYSIGL